MTEHPRLTLELVRDTAAEIVKDNPDKTIELCKYAAAAYEGPSCLVGALLYKLGWTYQELQDLDRRGASELGDSSIASLVEHEFVTADDAAAHYLDVLQAVQDGHEAWLQAYRAAEQVAV